MKIITIAIFELLIAIGIIGFWIYFFLVENKNPENSDIFLGYERSFPVPDLGWVAPSLIIAAIGILNHLKFGYIFTIAAGGALIFLGLVDISFNLQNGQYTKSFMDTLMNLVINAVCLIFGPLFIFFGSQSLQVI